MNNVPQGQNFRPRRNNNNSNYKKPGGGGRQDFRRSSSNSGHSFNQNSGSHHARHPELDIVIDSRAAQRAGTMRDKYQMMARDAQTGGDRVYGEYCLQHAEHYNRIINAYNESRPQQPVRTVSEDNEGYDNAQTTAEAQPEIVATPQPEIVAVAQQPAEVTAAPKPIRVVAAPRAAKIAITQPVIVEEEPSQQ